MKAGIKITQGDFEKLVEPKLKLFLSVDIVGSTHYKQRDKDAHAQNWLSLFLSFYGEFPSRFGEEIDKQKEGDGHHQDFDTVRLWKSLGDELIFTVVLRDRHQAGIYLKAFASALRSAATNWHTNSDPALNDLHLKGSAWLAGFPVGNAEIPMAIQVDERSMDSRDYIGPMIDTGFRIKEHSSPRRLVVSLELAYLLLSAGTTGLQFFYEGEPALKGVMRGIPYPVIWLEFDHLPADRKTALNHLRDKVSGREAVNTGHLKDYLKAWLEEHKLCLGKPFIRGDEFADLKAGPDYDQQLNNTINELRGVFVFVEDQEDTGGQPEMPAESMKLLQMSADTSASRRVKDLPKRQSPSQKAARKKPAVKTLTARKMPQEKAPRRRAGR